LERRDIWFLSPKRKKEGQLPPKKGGPTPIESIEEKGLGRKTDNANNYSLRGGGPCSDFGKVRRVERNGLEIQSLLQEPKFF